MWLLIAFIAVPLIEIGLFIEVGGWMGLWPTLAVVILTAVIGTALLRAQGVGALRNLQHSLEQGGYAGAALAHGAMILVAGVLLLTPGFFTDAVGFLLQTPPFRAFVIARLKERMSLRVATFSQTQGWREPEEGDVIDGEYEAADPERRTGGGQVGDGRPSGWRRPQ